MSLSVLMPVLFGSAGSSRVLFVDYSTMEVYEPDGSPTSPDLAREVVSEIERDQESSVPNIPYDQIREVMNTESDLAMKNAEHVYKRI